MDLQNVIANPDPRDDKYGDISFYFKDWYNHQVFGYKPTYPPPNFGNV